MEYLPQIVAGAVCPLSAWVMFYWIVKQVEAPKKAK